MSILERAGRARPMARAIGTSAARRLVMPGVETVASIRAAEPEFDDLRDRVLEAGSENPAFFGPEYRDGGLHLQQNPDEFTALCLLLRRQQPRATYLEI